MGPGIKRNIKRKKNLNLITMYVNHIMNMYLDAEAEI